MICRILYEEPACFRIVRVCKARWYNALGHRLAVVFARCQSRVYVGKLIKRRELIVIDSSCFAFGLQGLRFDIYKIQKSIRIT